ncbi:LysR substrate binding domain-containing protein [Nocardia amikacinitolerans]|nr:LysR family substrate-binding domain-containing protein [Nocardia amikacinitolerans]MCP2293181.1 LysR substrate binding domain-containing protein [Nocardia amikacinitolerans]
MGDDRSETNAAAAWETRVLRVGFLASAANEATTEIIAEFTARRPGWRVDMRQSAWSDPAAGLADGRVDVAILRLPIPGQEKWRVEVLLTEPRCVVLPATHRFADRDEIPFQELLDEPSSPPRKRPARGATIGWPSTSAAAFRRASVLSPNTRTTGSTR